MRLRKRKEKVKFPGHTSVPWVSLLGLIRGSKIPGIGIKVDVSGKTVHCVVCVRVVVHNPVPVGTSR